MQAPQDDMPATLVRQHATRHAPPPALAERILAQVRAEAPRPQASQRPRPPWYRWIESLALYGAGALSAWLAASVLIVAPPADPLAQEVMASHVRSLQADHLTDVTSSSHHTVKPWFAGRLDFSPPVADLAAQGYPLVGGRLDYLDGNTVAALVYRHDAHVINLFIWPAPPGAAADGAPQASSVRGYQLLRWHTHGMQAWAVSDMAAGELRAFARAVDLEPGD